MYQETFMQRERRQKNKLRAEKIAKIIVLIIIATPGLILGFFIGRMTAPTEQPLQEYNPDPCSLEVVVCEGEVGYSLN